MMSKQRGFTIVELLIVIVVIGILAAITIVAYNGIQNRAKSSSMVSDLRNIANQLEAYRVDGNTYPSSLSQLNNGQGVKLSSVNTTVEYLPSSGSSEPSFCAVATNGSMTYSVSNSQPPSESSCNVNIVANSSFEADTSSWGASGTATLSRSNVRATQGSYSLLIVGTGAAADRYIATTIPTSRSGNWKVTADVYLEAATATDYSRGLFVNNLPSTTSTGAAYNNTILNNWQTVSVNYLTPVGSTSMVVRFYVMTSSNIYVDNVKVTPL